MKSVAIVALLLLFPTAYLMAQECSVSVEVNGLINTEGKLRIGIFDNSEDFKNKENPAYSKSLVLADTSIKADIQNIEPGTYAIAVYHDENNDYQLNTKKLGIPSEGVGFSGISKSKIKPPDFETASFILKGDTAILIRMRYPK